MSARYALALAAAILLAAAAFLFAPIGPAVFVPEFADVRSAYRPSDAVLLDRHGEPLHEVRVDLRRRRFAWTRLDEVSPALVRSVLASEDRRFHSHGGIDGRALVAAGGQWLRGGPPRGGSTISMQVAGLFEHDSGRPGGRRTLRDKWLQMRAARALEAAWSKNQILEAYLNLVFFRGEVQGVRAAASLFFAKAPHGIDDAEGAVLAALLRAPNAAQGTVIRRAQDLGTESLPGALPDPIAAAAARATEGFVRGPGATLAPHVARLLIQTESDALPPAGVPSTLDAHLQRFVVDSLRRHLLALGGRNVRDGAVLVVDNASGEVLAYVGSSADLSRAPLVDGVRARRQAGSTLKPFLYALALEERLLTAASLVEDTPLETQVTGGLYRPHNYDHRFRGLVSVRTALAGSLNVPAVRTLALLSPDAFARHLTALGFRGVVEDGDFYGPALALGSADVSLWELTNAYRTLARGGQWSPLRLRPRPPAGGEERRPYSVETSFLIGDILSDRESRAVTFGLDSALATRFWTAVKTGTSKDMRDNWCVGYSSRYTAGVWVGNFSGEPMHDVSGVSGAAPVWADVMAWLNRQGEIARPSPPSNLVRTRVDFPAGGDTPRQEWFIAGTEPTSLPRRPNRQPRIVSPADGTRFALDPDIPPAMQRILLDAETAGTAVAWRLDGGELAPAEFPFLWEPLPGPHVVSLLDTGGGVLASVRFEVRGRRGAADRVGSSAP